MPACSFASQELNSLGLKIRTSQAIGDTCGAGRSLSPGHLYPHLLLPGFPVQVGAACVHRLQARGHR